METTPFRRSAAARSGGKMVREIRVPAGSRTPYARPSITPSVERQGTENPNWISGLIYPAKVIASGAGKILSFLGPDSSSASSSDSELSETDDGEEVENDASFQGDDQLDKVMSPSSKSDNKHSIEQLVMQETFSREEANELIKLIKSRAVDANGTFDENTSHMHTKAITEARKWLQKKRSGSKKKLDSELDVSNVATPSQATKYEKGSPVDMAKSYMQNRPTWASPSLKEAEFGSPSPLGMLHFKEETPRSTSFTSELKRSSFTSGSWNLLEEIRRVRSKATEELLAAAPLMKTILPSVAPESNPTQVSLTNKGDIEAAGPVECMHDRPENVLPDAALSSPSGVNQDGDAVQSVERQEAAELKSNKYDEVKEMQSSAAENGIAYAASGLVQAQAATQEPRPSVEENGNLVGSSQGPDIHMEENVDFQLQPATDIPTANPAETVVNGSHDSPSMQQEELLQEYSQLIVEQSSGAKARGTQRGRKSRGYTRGGRARAK